MSWNQSNELKRKGAKSKMQYIISLFPYFLHKLCPRLLLLSYV
jgi:hypothetical protein